MPTRAKQPSDRRSAAEPAPYVTLKWRNVPLPEAHIIALFAGGALQLLKPQAITTANAVLARAAGALLLGAGLALAGWSVAAAGDDVMDEANLLLTNGPYGISRNPMYLAWTFIVLGLGFLVNSVWVLGLIPFALVYLHLIEIPREEARLEETFGEEYLGYKRRVRKYL